MSVWKKQITLEKLLDTGRQFIDDEIRILHEYMTYSSEK